MASSSAETISINFTEDKPKVLFASPNTPERAVKVKDLEGKDLEAVMDHLELNRHRHRWSDSVFKDLPQYQINEIWKIEIKADVKCRQLYAKVKNLHKWHEQHKLQLQQQIEKQQQQIEKQQQQIEKLQNDFKMIQKRCNCGAFTESHEKLLTEHVKSGAQFNIKRVRSTLSLWRNELVGWKIVPVHLYHPRLQTVWNVAHYNVEISLD